VKRSSGLKLALMASTALILSGCGEDVATGGAYKTVEACIKGGEYTEADCRESHEAALKMHETSAPRYTDSRLCEQQHGYGNCQQSGSNNVWLPFFAGYFVSSFLNNQSMAGCRSSYWNSCTRPLYQGARGGYYTSSGYSLFRDSSSGKLAMYDGGIKNKPVAAKVQSRTTVAARGGFGSRSGGSGRGG
jgi:uncharacterized protein YgiB involved in biofilm formation